MKHAVEIKWIWDGLILFDPPNVPPPDHPLYPAMEVFEKKLESWAKTRRTRFNQPNELANDYLKNKGHARWVTGAHELMAQAVLRKNEASSQFELVCQPELEASIYAQALTLNLWPPADVFAGPVKLIGADPNMQGVPPTGLANRALHDEMGYAYASVPNTGHMLQLDAPQACANAVFEFLKDHGLHI
jgi:pimeloyl-ACP methyl ester carboxylesterase